MNLNPPPPPPPDPNSGLFRYTTSRFPDNRSSKIGSEITPNDTEWPQTEPEHLTVKRTLKTLNYSNDKVTQHGLQNFFRHVCPWN